MGSGTRRISGSASSRLVSNSLVAGQIALTLLLLTSAAAAITGFLKLAHTRLGYDPHNVMSVGLPLREQPYGNIESRATFVGGLRDRIAQVPGVTMAAVSSNATPPESGFSVPIDVLGQPGQQNGTVRWNLVSSDYFALLHVPLLEGRLWTDAEGRNAAQVAIVNQAFVRRYFPNSDPIGHSLRTDALKGEPPAVVVKDGAETWRQIIGVTADKLDQGIGKPVLPEVSVPFTTGMGPYTQILVRTQGPPTELTHAIALAVASLDSDQQVSSHVNDLQHWISTQPEYAQAQLVSWLFGAFAALALLLAAIGLYSVLSYTVAQRTSEFGIRMALGALRSDVLALVLRSTGRSVGSGLAIGLVLSLALHRVLAHLTSGTSIGALPILVALSLLLAAALAATAIPAHRATAIEPMEALRYE